MSPRDGEVNGLPANPLPNKTPAAKASFFYLPIIANGKSPAFEGWQKLSTDDEDQIQAWLDAGYNLAIDTGKSGLLVVDLDPGHVRPDNLPPTFERPTPRGGSHLYYKGACRGAGRKNLLGPHIDTRSIGGYVLCDPSETEHGVYGPGNGLPLAPTPVWIIDRLRPPETTTAANVEDVDLPHNIARATLWLQSTAPAIEGEGGDQRTYDTACAVLDLGVSPETAVRLMLEHWNERCDPPWDADELETKVANAVAYQLNEPGAWATADPLTRFSEPVALEVERQRSEAGPFVDLWEEFPLPRFPLDVLPPALQAYVEFTTRSLGTDPSAVALAALVACSGAIDHRVRLQMERNNAEWQAIPNLWGLNVGDPASEKSPIGRRVLKPLEKAESRLWTPYQQDRHAYENAKDHGKEVLKELYPDGPPKPPLQYLFNRTTEEALLEVLERQPRGALVYADEWAGWLGGMSKFGGKGAGQDNRAVWLSLRDGGSAKTNRKTVASIRAENASVSLLGNTQPDRLAELGGLESDGLLQRHLVCMMAPGGDKEDLADGGSIAAYESLIDGMLKVSEAQMQMSDGAYGEARRLRKFLDDLRRQPGLLRGFAGFIGKLPGIHGNLMIVLHLAGAQGVGEPISAATAIAASRIIEKFALWHAEALYDLLENGAKNREQLRALGATVLCSTKERFTLRDFTMQHKFLRDLSHRDQVEWIGRLLGLGYLTVENDGFMPKAWLAVPEARIALKGRIASLRIRNAEIAAKMQELRTARRG